MTLISKEDVKLVANFIQKPITDEQVDKVLEQYEEAEKEDPTATWNLIVENLIYNL